MIVVQWPPPPPPPSKFRANWPRNGAAFLTSSLSKPKFGSKFSIKCSCIKEEHTPKASYSEDFSLLESNIPWDSGSIWSTFALYLFSLHVPLSFGGLSVVAHFVHQPVLDPQTEALSLLAIQILELNAVLWLLRCVAKPQHKIFSFFQPKNQSKERNWLLASILGFGSLVLLVFFTSLVADQLVGPKDVNNPILKEILSSGSISETACILVYCIVTPLLEEIVYRGFLLTSLASEMKWYQAVAISSAVFSAAHFSVMEDFQMFEESQMFQHNTDINFMSETSREQNTQSSDNHFISETSRVSRGKAFTIIEDEILCRSWLVVSQDPITGNSQTMVIFWERVLVNFNSQLSGESNRNRISLSHRWSVMQKAINKFCGFLEQIQLRQQSGTTEADMVAEAKRMYHAIQKKHFTFDTCWDILRRSCKWNEFRTQSKKSTQHAYPCSNPPTGESDAFQSNQNNVLHEEPSNPSTRPIGTKAAKEKLKNQTTHDSRFDEMAANQSKMVEVLSTISARTIELDEQKAIDRNQKAADRRRRAEDREEQLKLLSMMNEREQRNEDYKIMSMDMTNLNPMQRAYYEDLQRQILFRTTNRLP